MARPNALQFLKKGMLLAGKVFPRFVETWNWLVGAVDSFCGDADVNPNQGYISVDRANPDRPVIRFNAAKLPACGGEGKEYIAGDDTNIVFTEVTSQSDPDYGKVKVDVYYA